MLDTYIVHSPAPVHCLYHCQCLRACPGQEIKDPSNLCNKTNEAICAENFNLVMDINLKYWPHLARPASFLSRFSLALLKEYFILKSSHH